MKKVQYGQYFTKSSVWLRPQIIDFIKQSNCKIAYDPFAGDGDLLKVSKLYGINKTIGKDIDESLDWQINDSLISIPSYQEAIIITNPPYLAKNSATRKKIDLSKYFNRSKYDDLYLIALETMIKAQKYIVAIIPESFINSNFKQKQFLNSITILEQNPFNDTEQPVCIVCFDGVLKDFSDIKIYKNDIYIGTLDQLENIRLNPDKSIQIKFNDPNGWLGLRAIDSSNDNNKIEFNFKDKIKYDWNRLNHTSRHFTLISIEVSDHLKTKFINKCNEILCQIRTKSADAILTAFMGNTKTGIRRRRLDFKLARAIIETALKEL
ncbi:Eco57I restriction-modification methylase domain-containing protein [Mycoplasma nasistruthionis]|uniref:Type II methyltransferase M.TaqI-like domain-containing protein n=1 Tax=Mycoplasma nasistruthionis TaxID=353852 RepID=A0A4Y6I5A4_9MOLU|nr:hypothetical protein [Mycoplasma nasistruthionis]QDF64784.1 hypothetical protein FIV53_00425 [Mycoplasma nasistruthionis]